MGGKAAAEAGHGRDDARFRAGTRADKPALLSDQGHAAAGWAGRPHAPHPALNPYFCRRKIHHKDTKSTKMSFPPIPADIEKVGRSIVDAGLKVHAALGLGLLESVYEHRLAFELQQRGLEV